jgi:N-acetylmuramoyl-L-alanine amidase
VPESDVNRLSLLPLHEGTRGDAVFDLQLRLSELDLVCTDAPGRFGHTTAEAIRQFQARRGLPPSGVCDEATWTALVEAGYRLGSRLLYRRAPMFRGDDVAELQRRLSGLGFDPGQIDGIFGDQTAHALDEFQRNAGLPADGRCGRETLSLLLRLSMREGATDLVTPVRERLRVASGSKALSSRHFAVGEQGGFEHGVTAVARVLRDAGASTLELHDPDASMQAAQANAADVDGFVSLRLLPEQVDCRTVYYEGFRYVSVSAQRLASALQHRLPACLGIADGGICGMPLPILRETRMPAIEVQLGAPSQVLQRTPELGNAIVQAIMEWLERE